MSEEKFFLPHQHIKNLFVFLSEKLTLSRSATRFKRALWFLCADAGALDRRNGSVGFVRPSSRGEKMKLQFGITISSSGAFLAPASITAGRWQPSEQTVRNFGGRNSDPQLAAGWIAERRLDAALDVIRILHELSPPREREMLLWRDEEGKHKCVSQESDESYRSRVERWLAEPDEARDRRIAARLERLSGTLEGAWCVRVPKQ